MGLRNRTLNITPAAYFVTASTTEHKQVFLHENVKIAQDTLLEVFATKNIRLIAYVIMSSHIHFLAWLKGGGPELSSLMSSLKGLIRVRTVGSLNLWEHRFYDEQIRYETMLNQKVEYIHTNPVRAGLVVTPTDYPYSSARVWAGIETDSRIWTDLGTISSD